MTRDLVSLLLMVEVHFLLLFKVMSETYYKKLQLSYLKSMEEVVNRQTDLLDSEKKKDIIMRTELRNSPFKTLLLTIDQMSRVLLWLVVLILKQSSNNPTDLIKDLLKSLLPLLMFHMEVKMDLVKPLLNLLMLSVM